MTSLISVGLVGSALLAATLYRLRAWSKKELWRVLAFGSAILIVSGLNLLIPAQSKNPLWGAIVGFSVFFVLESYAMIHSCQEYLEECPVHWMGKMTALALSTHSFLDGLILGISSQVGMGPFLSVLAAMAIHKFADALTCLALFQEELEGSYVKHVGLVVAITLFTPLGALCASWLMPFIATSGILEILAGFSAGSLIYIGSSDIIPRIHKLNDPACLGIFLAGITCAVFILEAFH